MSRLLEGGQLFERAGVLFSHVKGTRLPPSASAHRPELAGRGWEAMGVSMVLHPRNPYVPTTHMNVRMFVAAARPGHAESDVFWFGGGLDLTRTTRSRTTRAISTAPAATRWTRTAPITTRATSSGATNTSSSSTATKPAASAASSSTI